MELKYMNEAISYFRRYPVYDRLFVAMREKYASLGHLGGSFVLSDLTAEDREVLSGFTGMDLGRDPTAKISFSVLNKALVKSRFGMLAWEEILVQYFGQPLSVKRVEKRQRQEERNVFWESYLSQCKNKEVKAWLSGILLEHRQGYRIMERQYNTDKEETGHLLRNIIDALEHLPAIENRTQLLPVFAAEVTGNPHYFDDGTTACNLLLNYGVYRFGQTDEIVSGVEQRESVLYQMGILRDELSNACIAYNVEGWKEDGCLHEGLHGFYRERQAFQLTLNILGRLTGLRSAQNCDHKIYMVENPAVFSYLVKKYPDHTFLCTLGQLKLAAYAAIDLFPKTDVFYYAGDFDPDGLQIAQGLKKRYGERLRLWNYKRQYYEQAISDLTIDDVGLKKLEKITLPELADIRQCLMQYQRAAYQERMLDYYIVGEELHF